MITRSLRFLVGLALLPLCLAAGQTVAAVMCAVPTAAGGVIPPAAWSLAGGFLLWLLVYILVPSPVRTYVLAHELTHALWGAVMGAKVSRMRVSKDGGSVTLSKSNVLVVLAPYFFPLYTVLVMLAYALLSFFVEMADYYLLWLGLVGFTWGFHFTFTAGMLLRRQTDILEYGAVFSYVVILLLNLLGLAFWVAAVTPVGLDTLAFMFTGHVANDYLWLGETCCRLLAGFAQ